MANFFQLLPLDVQHNVVQYWLSGIGSTDIFRHGIQILIKILSALDIACCNRSNRGQYLTLSSRVTFNATDDPNYRNSCLVADLLGFMRWIHTRSIALRIVCPIEENIPKLEQFAKSCKELPFTLPFVTCVRLNLDVESLRWYSWTSWLPYLLKVCPNLTRIESSVQDYQMNKLIWKAIGMSHLPCLQAISVRSDGRDEAMLAAVIKFGPQLEELGIDDIPLDHDVWKYLVNQGCPCLQKLRCGRFSETFHKLFTSCPQLTDLTANIRIENVPEILEASHRKLKRLKVHGVFFADPLLVADILERFPFVDEFSMAGYDVCRSTGSLRLGSGVPRKRITFADFARFISCCPFAKLSLTMDEPAQLGDDFEVFQTNLQSAFCQLEDLTIHARWLEVIAPYLQLCLLNRLQCSGELTRDCFLKIASDCSNLKYLSLQNTSMTQEDLTMLLIGCPALKEVDLAAAPKLGYKVLVQMLLEAKARLNKICWSGAGIIGDDEVKWFRSLAVERQLIPVPELVRVFRI